MLREGKKYHFQEGGGINVVFGPIYRPLDPDAIKLEKWDTELPKEKWLDPQYCKEHRKKVM
jgi:hypothetical protein